MEHLRDQARTDWWLLTLIILAFGTQVALTVDEQAWTDPTWDGTGPGGHHRDRTLQL